MYLFFDTETTGKPKAYNAPMTDIDNWPRVIQLAWLLTDQDGNELSKRELLIKPDGWKVPDGSNGEDWTFWREHGFSTEACEERGRPMPEVLKNFVNDLERAEYMVSHNMAFDKNVLGAEMLRYQARGKRVPKICTMNASVDFCKIPFSGHRSWLSKQGRYKWPKLGELHVLLFGREMEGGHQASEDVKALRDCFFALLRIGIIDPKTYTL